MVFLQPHHDVIEEVLTDLAASVIGPGFSPRRAGPVVVVEVDSAAIVLAPAVELPKIEIAGAQVVVNNVQDHRDALLVGALDELFERQRAAVGGLHREDMGGVVTPRPLSRKLAHRHDLDRIDAELFQMSQTCRHRGELARMVGVLLVVEGADMKFVDDQLVPRREMEVVPLPVEARIVNDGVADRAGHLTGIRVDALELALRRGQEEPILIARMSRRHVGVPVAVLLNLHGMLAAVPVVERSDDGYSLRMGRPHAEGDSLRMQNRSHALDFGFSAHNWFLQYQGHPTSLAMGIAVPSDATAFLLSTIS